MEIVKQKGSKQSDYLFKFDEYVKGWEQFVFVDIKNNLPVITEIRWVKSNDEHEVELNSTTYRELPIGDVKERVSSYIELESMDFKEGNKTITDLDYKDILELANNYIHLYPVIETKWKDERNALVYVSYYLLELNSYFNDSLHWENKELDLHSRISKRLGLSKSNSIQILNRLKEAGYLRSTDSTVSLIPTIKYVNSILNIVSEPKKFVEKIYKAFSNAYKKYEAKVWDHWEDYYYSYTYLENVETFMVLGTEYYDDSKDEQLAQLKQDEFDNLSFEEVCDILSYLELWDIDEHINNKYVGSINGDLSVEFRIDDSYLKEIRKSNKYKNDMELAMDEKLIDEIFKDLNIDNYFELKDIESKWAEQAEGKKVSGNLNQGYDEDEAPF